MRGLYVNCDNSLIPASTELANKYSEILIFPSELGVGRTIYSAQEWPNKPITTYKCNTFIVSGWFIYKGVRNNLALLAADICEQGVSVINDILAGTFLIFWWDGSSGKVLVDPMGMSSHYIDNTSQKLRIAPSVKVLYDSALHFHNPLQPSQSLFPVYPLVTRKTSLLNQTRYVSLDLD